MQEKIPWKRYYTTKNRVIAHFLFWIIVGVLFYVSFIRIDQNLAWILISKDLFVAIIVYYTSAYYIIPKWLMKGKYILCILWAISTYAFWGIISYTAYALINKHFVPSPQLQYYIDVILDNGILGVFKWSEIPVYLLDFIYLIALPITLKLMQSYFYQKVERVKLERDNLELELNFLKSQLNPHFLFNSLNNIYRMVNKNDVKAGDTILSLADLIRYTLYQSDAHFVPLNNEIDFLKNFLKLERLRFSDKVEIITHIEEDRFDKYIPPLIFFPFIENAFKHGPEKSQKSAWVHINLISDNEMLTLEVSNAVNKKNNKTMTEEGGVGTINSRKRLELNYKNNYILTTTDLEDSYKVSLQIKFNKPNLQ